MTELAHVLRALMREKNLKSTQKVAAFTGVSQPTIYRILSIDGYSPEDNVVKKMAKAFNISEAEMRGLVALHELREEPSAYTLQRYPKVLGTARCGDEGYYMELEGGDGYLEIDAAPGSLAIRIKGHSMHPAIRENWFVIVEPNKPPTVGEYALAKFKNGKKMVKEVLQIRSDGYLLLSVNGGERITALFDELEEDLQAVTAIVPPSKHKEFQP